MTIDIWFREVSWILLTNNSKEVSHTWYQDFGYIDYGSRLITLGFLNSLYSLDISPRSDMYLAKILSHSVGLLFTQFISSFVVKKHFYFIRHHQSSVAHNSWANGALIAKFLPTPTSCRFMPRFPSNSYSILGSTLRLFIHCQLIFVQGPRYESTFVVLNVDTQIFQHHLLKMLSFLQYVFLTSLL